MRVLRLTEPRMTGPDVEMWQHFLIGIMPISLIVDGIFGEATDNATREFQRLASLDQDGVVGRNTLSVALKNGYSAISDDLPGKLGPNWPQPIGDLKTNVVETLGQIPFAPSPTHQNPEGIAIKSSWVENNITSFEIPQLARAKGIKLVTFHKIVKQPVLELFQAWDDAGLIDRIITWDGSWVPRFIRGSRTTLSNHAYGTAFDINASFNGLGRQPVLLNQPGCVRELAEIADVQGWTWGGFYKSRPDGMHFERRFDVKR